MMGLAACFGEAITDLCGRLARQIEEL